MNHHYVLDDFTDQPCCTHCKQVGTRETRLNKDGLGFIDRPVRGCPGPKQQSDFIRQR